jgi:hypothetical protein
MRLYCFAFLAAVCLLTPSAYSQNNKIITDRPGESQSAALVSKGYFQLETDFRKNQEKNGDYSVTHPALNLRYGLFGRLELRAELQSETEKRFTENQFNHGLKPVELGLKAKLLENHGLLPSTSFYTQIGIPNWAAEEHQKSHVFPKLRLLMENKLTDKLTLNYNAGAEWQGDGGAPQWIYTIEPAWELSDKWDVFVETFAYLQQGHGPRHYVDGGFAYYSAKNWKLDLWAGKGLSIESSDYFLSAGISFRLK